MDRTTAGLDLSRRQMKTRSRNANGEQLRIHALSYIRESARRTIFSFQLGAIVPLFLKTSILAMHMPVTPYSQATH